jgi:hypothetical protein
MKIPIVDKFLFGKIAKPINSKTSKIWPDFEVSSAILILGEAFQSSSKIQALQNIADMIYK